MMTFRRHFQVISSLRHDNYICNFFCHQIEEILHLVISSASYSISTKMNYIFERKYIFSKGFKIKTFHSPTHCYDDP
jgi:hypothetical protein